MTRDICQAVGSLITDLYFITCTHFSPPASPHHHAFISGDEVCCNALIIVILKVFADNRLPLALFDCRSRSEYSILYLKILLVDNVKIGLNIIIVLVVLVVMLLLMIVLMKRYWRSQQYNQME